MIEELPRTILAVLARMPTWLRRDLAAVDEPTRDRAEEALAAMIASALDEQRID